MAATVTVSELLDGHVGLDIESLDRVYLNGYVPTLQVGGQVAGFMTRHLGYEIPSPVIMEKIGTSFRRAVHAFAAGNQVPIVTFAKTDRKQEIMRPHLTRQARTGRSGVAAIGVAQEYQNVFACSRREDRGDTGRQVWFTFHKADRRVTCFYLYLWDEDFGPAFIKICAYFPYPASVPAGRGPAGEPFRLDFELYELPKLFRDVADRWDDLFQPIPGRPDYRTIISLGVLVPVRCVDAQLGRDGVIELLSLDVDPRPISGDVDSADHEDE